VIFAVPESGAFPGRAVGEALQARLPGAGVLICPAGRWGTAIRADRAQRLCGPPEVQLSIGGMRLEASPAAWTPLSAAGAEALAALILEQLGPAQERRLLEVGCGIGSVSLLLARAGFLVEGFDSRWSAVLDARRNAERNGIAGARFHAAAAPGAIRRLLARGRRYDTAFIHALRKPYGEQTFALFAELGIRQVVYCSPYPANLARDAAALVRRGWRLTHATPIDLIPYSNHVLVVAGFVRQGVPA
jgi:23S rRNA (uracil1939-C5)-methyltransferase